MLILKGGLQRHHLVVCSHGVEENPYSIPDRLFRRIITKPSRDRVRFDKNCQPIDSERHLTREKSLIVTEDHL